MLVLHCIVSLYIDVAILIKYLTLRMKKMRIVKYYIIIIFVYLNYVFGVEELE